MLNKNNILNDENNSNLKLDPNFIIGLTESEGSFSVFLHKDKRAKFKVNVSLRYKITMLENETKLLEMVKYFFNCGVFAHKKNGIVSFTVRDFYSIKNVVIPHFLKYPLRGTKYLDFISFKEAFHVIESKEHLTIEGIKKIYLIGKEMNSYRKLLLSDLYSPDHTKEENINLIPINGNYINGFIAGDGCLALTLRGKNFGRMSLQISQHINNRLLLKSIAIYFNSPSKVYTHDTNSLQITLSGFKLWESVIFKHFSVYALHGSKKLTLNKLLHIRKLFLGNKHLVQVGRSRE